MHKLFISPSDVDGKFISVKGEDVEHLHALRVREGDLLRVSDGVSRVYEAKAAQIRKDAVLLDIVSEKPFENEPCLSLTVCIASLKGDGCEDVIRQAVELGASRIVIFSSENCVADKRGKTDRYAKIARQAAMQSGRDIIPSVNGIVSFDEMIEILSEAEFSAFFHESASDPLYPYISAHEKSPRSAAFCVGPEGGFSEKEVAFARNAGIPVLSLGKRILRAVTAPVYAASVIMSVFDEPRCCN